MRLLEEVLPRVFQGFKVILFSRPSLALWTFSLLQLPAALAHAQSSSNHQYRSRLTALRTSPLAFAHLAVVCSPPKAVLSFCPLSSSHRVSFSGEPPLPPCLNGPSSLVYRSRPPMSFGDLLLRNLSLSRARRQSESSSHSLP